MKDRIKAIRNSQNMSQTEFAKRLLVSRSAICKMESGENSPSDQTINLICREFNINEDWLRNGIEPMEKPRSGKLSYYMSDIVAGDDDFIRDLIEVYMELDKTSKDALKEIAKKMADKQKGRE